MATFPLLALRCRIPSAQRAFHRFAAATAGLTLLLHGAAAQNAPAPAPAPAGEILELSPFEVRADTDVGYQASNTTLLATVNNQVAVIEEELETLARNQNSPFATRPHKLNFTMRYKFIEGALKGAFVGGGVRWKSPMAASGDV